MSLPSPDLIPTSETDTTLGQVFYLGEVKGNPIRIFRVPDTDGPSILLPLVGRLEPNRESLIEARFALAGSSPLNPNQLANTQNMLDKGYPPLLALYVGQSDLNPDNYPKLDHPVYLISLYGPSHVGKTTLAKAIAQEHPRQFGYFDFDTYSKGKQTKTFSQLTDSLLTCIRQNPKEIVICDMPGAGNRSGDIFDFAAVTAFDAGYDVLGPGILEDNLEQFNQGRDKLFDEAIGYQSYFLQAVKSLANST